MKTLILKIEPSQRKWLVIDLKDVILGRAAIRVADALRGKDKPIFSPHLDNGDNIIAINADAVRVTGKKLAQKKFYRYSGYPGGLKATTLGDKLAQQPSEVFRLAVKRMLPKNRLGRKQLKKLHVYAGAEHPHKAQNPQKLELR